MFSHSYSEARDKFKSLAAKAGMQQKSYVMSDVLGPDGEELSTDVAYRINEKTRNFF